MSKRVLSTVGPVCLCIIGIFVVIGSLYGVYKFKGWKCAGAFFGFLLGIAMIIGALILMGEIET
jgi:glycerol-3-phosphate acyltransferase PlsY